MRSTESQRRIIPQGIERHMSASIGITRMAPLLGVASVVLAACSSGADRAASRDTMAMTTAAAPETAATSQAAAESSAITDSTAKMRTQSAGVTPAPAAKTRVRPSIDPGRKSTTASSPKAAAADTAASATNDTATQSAAAQPIPAARLRNPVRRQARTSF